MTNPWEHLQILPDASLDGLYELGEGVTLEWRDSGRIMIFDMPTPTRSAVDIQFNTIESIQESWDAETPMSIAIIAGSKSPTPYLRQRATTMLDSEVSLQRKGKITVILQKGFLSKVAQMFVNRQSRRAGTAFKFQAVYSLEDALNWLRDDSA